MLHGKRDSDVEGLGLSAVLLGRGLVSLTSIPERCHGSPWVGQRRLTGVPASPDTRWRIPYATIGS